ncbi:hypothetical protein AMS68_005204 [Peltaster fructicola]|uniref:Uncharacterized protein n=1 Tax=Peltaster fructicola TaxID=286661 RepID=A0A6H0XY33_9PEZI|nr:hypothetical protein AMS68_005204 [Peltaster fructicola]
MLPNTVFLRSSSGGQQPESLRISPVERAKRPIDNTSSFREICCSYTQLTTINKTVVLKLSTQIILREQTERLTTT